MPRKVFKGIHPNGYKSLTNDLPIVNMDVPPKVYIPIEARGDFEVFVSVGDKVSAGTLIAKGIVNVFASCSGTVSAIKKRRVISGRLATHVVIVNDGLYTSVSLPILENPSPQEITERVTYAGITGMSGSGFPTGAKLSLDKKIDYVLINGCECEPYINCDNSLMLYEPKRVIEGAILLKEAVGAKTAIIAIEDNKPRAIETISSLASSYKDVEVRKLPTIYPQGDARRLIASVLGLKIPQRKRTTDCGIIVNNVQTAYAVYMAVREGVPCYSRVMTVSGGGIKNPANLRVAHGTRFSEIIEYCGGYDVDNTVRIISGGAMMGTALLDSTYASCNTTGSILLLTPPETTLRNSSPCINCAKCAKVCPANIMPMYIDLYTRVEDFETAKKYGAELCIECGCCAYVCPAKRALVTSMKQAKWALSAMRKEAKSKK